MESAAGGAEAQSVGSEAQSVGSEAQRITRAVVGTSRNSQLPEL